MKYIKAKPVYYNMFTGLKSGTRINKNQTCFDSTSEFRLYLLLAKYFDDSFFHIDVHPSLSIGATKWNIDFKISAYNNDKESKFFLGALANSINGTNYNSLNTIYIEYKGHQDKNFLLKMGKIATIAPNFAKTIILVAGDTQAFGCYDEKKGNFYCQPIASVLLFDQIIRKYTREGINNGTH